MAYICGYDVICTEFVVMTFGDYHHKPRMIPNYLTSVRIIHFLQRIYCRVILICGIC